MHFHLLIIQFQLFDHLHDLIHPNNYQGPSIIFNYFILLIVVYFEHHSFIFMRLTAYLKNLKAYFTHLKIIVKHLKVDSLEMQFLGLFSLINLLNNPDQISINPCHAIYPLSRLIEN